MLSRLFALLILIGLVLAGLYYWKYRPETARAESLGPFGERLGAARDTVSEGLREARTEGAVKAALQIHRTLAPLPLEVDAEGDTVVLRGEVPSEDLRASAERVAAGVTGVATVRNEIRVNPAMTLPAPGGRSMGENLDDRALEAKVRLAFSLNRGMEGSDVNVSVYRREVALSGTVVSAAQRELALQLAHDTAGVAAVADHLAGPPGSAAAAPQETARGVTSERAQAAERALATHASLRAYGLRVREEQGQLSVTGRVTTPAERDLAAYVAREAAGTNVQSKITLMR